MHQNILEVFCCMPLPRQQEATAGLRDQFSLHIILVYEWVNVHIQQYNTLTQRIESRCTGMQRLNSETGCSKMATWLTGKKTKSIMRPQTAEDSRTTCALLLCQHGARYKKPLLNICQRMHVHAFSTLAATLPTTLDAPTTTCMIHMHVWRVHLRTSNHTHSN